MDEIYRSNCQLGIFSSKLDLILYPRKFSIMNNLQYTVLVHYTASCLHNYQCARSRIIDYKLMLTHAMMLSLVVVYKPLTSI